MLDKFRKDCGNTNFKEAIMRGVQAIVVIASLLFSLMAST
jgi:hypothetical protein